jgi:predicted HicB family RNase H-like nuclease
MNTMSYKGYAARVEFDDEDGIFFGRIAGIRDGVGFHGDNVADLRNAFREAVDDYIATCAKVGKEPQKPYSGQIMVRVDPAVHARAALAAELAGKSLAKWAEEGLRERADLELAGRGCGA